MYAESWRCASGRPWRRPGAAALAVADLAAPRSSRARTGLLQGLLLAAGLPLIGAAARADLHLVAAPGEVQAQNPKGLVVWKYRFADGRSAQPRLCDAGLIRLDRGLFADREGRALGRIDPRGPSHGAPDRLGQVCPYWDPLFQLASSDSVYHPLRPLFDSGGNAWEFFQCYAGDHWISYRRSEGNSGRWGPLVELELPPDLDPSNVDVTIGPDDWITVAFRDISGGQYRLMATRLRVDHPLPEVPQVLHSQSTFWQNLEIGADAFGNVAVVIGSGHTAIYDAAAGGWRPAYLLAPSCAIPTVFANRQRTALYVVYHGGDGLYAHRFDSAAVDWEPAQFLPGSEVATVYGGPVSRYPAAAGGDNEATVFWQDWDEGISAVYASRTSHGLWQPARQLLGPGSDPVLLDFSNADATQRGDVFCVLTRREGAELALRALRYNAWTGRWEPPARPWSGPYGGSTWSRIRFYRGTHAVAVFSPDLGGSESTSLLYNDCVGWGEHLLDIPGNYYSVPLETGSDGDDALLVFEAHIGSVVGPRDGVWASWLRYLVGDLDNDGDVDLADLALLLANYGEGPCGDLDGNGSVDLADLALLLANYGRECP